MAIMNHTLPAAGTPSMRSPDDIDDIVIDACALIARIILLAPAERQRAICDLVLREIGDIVDHVLNDDKPTEC
jgi:hypothetical protein